MPLARPLGIGVRFFVVPALPLAQGLCSISLEVSLRSGGGIHPDFMGTSPWRGHVPSGTWRGKLAATPVRADP